MKTLFTKRETQLILLISKGYENKEIAKNLFISTRTVETHRTNILRKLNAKNFYKVISYCYENGIIKITASPKKELLVTRKTA